MAEPMANRNTRRPWRIGNPSSAATLDGHEASCSRAPRREGEAQGADLSYTRHRAAPLVPPAAPLLVSEERARAAMASHRRPVPHPRLRGDAAADAGRSRAAEVRGVAH